jgi:hypothetical protein
MDATPEPLEVQAPTEAPAPPPVVEDDHIDDSQTFDAKYVRGLRDEAAKYRHAARDSVEQANARIFALALQSDGRLIDPEALAIDEAVLGEDGLVDPVKVSDAIAQLIEAKPFLAAHRPRALLPQGVQEVLPEPKSLTALIRERM